MFLVRSKKLSDIEKEFIKMPICGCSACESKKRHLKRTINKKRLEFLETLRHDHKHHDNSLL